MEFRFETIEYDRSLPALPKHSGVYKIFDIHGKLIVLDKTSNLFERLERYYGERSERVRDLDLREITGRIEYIRTDSTCETLYILYRERKKYFPKTYRKMRTFRLFTLMKINRKQRFPRIYASRQIKPGVDYFGPFISRGQFSRLKTTLERTFKLRPCLYNIRGGDPHPDCLYFQMHTCSRPCNDDIDREGYSADVDAAIRFIQGHDEELAAGLMREINELAAEERFEDAERRRRQLEKIQRARKEFKDKFPSVWGFDYLVLLPSDSTVRTRIAFVRSGSIVQFGDFEAPTLHEVIPAEAARIFNEPQPASNREWQYDELCIEAN